MEIVTQKNLNLQKFSEEIIAISPEASICQLGEYCPIEGSKIIADRRIEDFDKEHKTLFVIENTSLSESEMQAIIEAHDFDAAQNEEKLKKIRKDRDEKLANCDWIILRDDEQKENPPRKFDDTKRAEWLLYRQALRDFPANCDPNNPVWPSSPE